MVKLPCVVFDSVAEEFTCVINKVWIGFKQIDESFVKSYFFILLCRSQDRIVLLFWTFSPPAKIA